VQTNINMLTTKIAELVRQSEKLGEDGDVDGSVAAAAQADTLKVQAQGSLHIRSMLLMTSPTRDRVGVAMQSQKANLEKEAAERAAKRTGSQQYVCEVRLQHHVQALAECPQHRPPCRLLCGVAVS
jgi:hypothetical protein